MRGRGLIALVMSINILFAAAACGGGDGGGGGQNTDPSLPPSTTEYVYGDSHKDEYDGAFTERLLSQGAQRFTYGQLKGTDDAGRKLAPIGEVGKGKYVGIFYFLWQKEGNGLYDISKLLESYGATDTSRNPLWALPGNPNFDEAISPMNAFHYFEEPLYGYYASTDKWVIMRHLELLTYAGVDFLYLDFTNASSDSPENTPSNIYPEATYALLDSILALRARGIECPRIVPVVCNPMTKNGGEEGDRARSAVVEWVYENYYAKDHFKYRGCWFTADGEHNPTGKPLLVSYTIDRKYFSNKAAYDAFWYRTVVWPTMVTEDSYQNGFPWMDYSLPQSNYDGIMNVSVAQHLGGSWSSEAFLARSRRDRGLLYRGRGAVGGERRAIETDDFDRAILGLNFAEQWENVFSAREEPWLVTVTGWNEWTAQKLDFGRGISCFVDTFSLAFSRDIEMMRDESGYGDNFYMQLAANIAKYKSLPSARASEAAMWKKQTPVWDDPASWEGVKAKYLALAGDVSPRDNASVGGVYRYTDDSARNDIEYLKLANDEEYLYALVKTKAPVTAHEEGDENWMNLYLSLAGKGWAGTDVIVNRRPADGTTSVERVRETQDGALETEEIARADYCVRGEYLLFRIPLSAIGATSADELGVKVADNIFGVKRTKENDGVGVYGFGETEALYCGGDMAPRGRLFYAYRMAY